MIHKIKFIEFFYKFFALQDFIKVGLSFLLKNPTKIVYQMGTDIIFNPQFELLTCPFMEKCELPKLGFLCKIPDCKNCTEYSDWLKKLKSRILY